MIQMLLGLFNGLLSWLFVKWPVAGLLLQDLLLMVLDALVVKLAGET